MSIQAVTSDVKGAVPADETVPARENLDRALRLVTQAAGELATFCDKAEHNESNDPDVIRSQAKVLRNVAEALARDAETPLGSYYVSRIRSLEGSHPLASPDAPETWRAIGCAHTWRDLQLAQQRHDRFYHPDIFGMSKQDQLRHYALHVTKIAGSLARVCSEPDRWYRFSSERLPDLLLFGVKLATVAGEDLPQEQLPLPLE